MKFFNNKYLYSSNELSDIPYKINKYEFPVFELNENNICDLDKFIYEKENIGLKIVKTINISNIFKTLLKYILKNIKCIIIYGIYNIKDILDCLPNVEFIRMETEKFYTLELDLFNNLHNLKYLLINNFNIINSNNIQYNNKLIYLELTNSIVDDENILLYVNKNLHYLKLFKTYVKLCYLEEFINLKYISIWDKNMYVEGNYIKNMTNLQIMEIYNIDNVCDIEKFYDLKVVRLSLCNQIIDIKNLEFFHNIESLDIECNNMTYIESFEYLTKLKYLSINSYNTINNILYNINSSSLEILNISINTCNNEAINFELLKNMINLRSFKLVDENYNTFLIIDLNIIMKMKNLENLYIENIYIKNIENINYLNNIKNLNLINNKISNIDFIYNNINIIELNLSRNLIYDITNLKYLKKLKKLSLNTNNIIDISPILHLNKLDYINIKYNNLNDINILKYIKSESKQINIYIDKIYIHDKLQEHKLLKIFYI
ncbi:leucine rich repeat gene family [Choristoneura biennis entomopoxvirus]|uniref:Leucine rich repeat gene family n=1 Tax=Choristoneura biennis entomopoxvirus TaxID=10288 RepID=A0A916NY36_CBEPV|nr:leucine rich repeat gene family [Choristoneura biennis entomopoxvirus]CCU55857.1 leucine rich repeat gene family [Choristoneura biennis entomopoxvirus]